MCAKDSRILRELVKQMLEIAALPANREKRELWSRHFSLHETRPLILAGFGMHNVWCREVFSDETMQCSDPFLRQYERLLRMSLFRAQVGDDYVFKPWLEVAAVKPGDWDSPWGLKQGRIASDLEGGSWQYDPPLREWSDMDKLKAAPHLIDEARTEENRSRLYDAVGDLVPIAVNRGPFYLGFNADISTHLARLRGLEQLMVDMYESPDELHRLLAFMRDGILENINTAEAAGDLSLLNHENQAMPYCMELEPPVPDGGPRRCGDLWFFSAAQEYTLISPGFHEEFLLQYQKPIIERFGLSHYGCCENLTNKIDMLRKLNNLRSIAVTPVADVARCAELIGSDYAFSWRPNPTDMVSCGGFNPDRIRSILVPGLKAARRCGCRVHLHLKDVETMEG